MKIFFRSISSVAFGMILLYSCHQKIEVTMNSAPVAKKHPKELTLHGDTRIDQYYWMRLSDEQKNAKNPDGHTLEVMDYLNSENDYLKKQMAHTESLQESLYEEMTGRIKQDEESA
ncbi:MAG: hypothetical protein OEY51_06570, partial [Cyclobacteriaceae bacterium]|nr:hypothetical protein [Cyclobacteriaceae bacterium]